MFGCVNGGLTCFSPCDNFKWSLFSKSIDICPIIAFNPLGCRRIGESNPHRRVASQRASSLSLYSSYRYRRNEQKENELWIQRKRKNTSNRDREYFVLSFPMNILCILCYTAHVRIQIFAHCQTRKYDGVLWNCNHGWAQSLDRNLINWNTWRENFKRREGTMTGVIKIHKFLYICNNSYRLDIQIMIVVDIHKFTKLRIMMKLQ